MEQSKKLYDILVKPIYTIYNDVWVMVRKQPYLVRIPVTEKKNIRELAFNKIRYHLEHPSPQKRGPKPKYQYKNKQEANKIYNKVWKENKKKKLIEAE